MRKREILRWDLMMSRCIEVFSCWPPVFSAFVNTLEVMGVFDTDLFNLLDLGLQFFRLLQVPVVLSPARKWAPSYAPLGAGHAVGSSEWVSQGATWRPAEGLHRYAGRDVNIEGVERRK